MSYDLSVGYEAELLSFVEDDMTFLAMNPNLFVELWAGADFSISTSFFVGHIYLEFVPASYVPFDFQAAWNLEQQDDFCHSISRTRTAMDLDVYLESEVKECTSGLRGYIREDLSYDCVWKNYQPTLPLYTLSFTDDYDETNDIKAWTCSCDVEGDDMYFEEDSGVYDDVVYEGEGIITDEFTDSF